MCFGALYTLFSVIGTSEASVLSHKTTADSVFRISSVVGGVCPALRGVYSDTTQLNSTDPVEQRAAKSVMLLFMTSRPTN